MEDRMKDTKKSTDADSEAENFQEAFKVMVELFNHVFGTAMPTSPIQGARARFAFPKPQHQNGELHMEADQFNTESLDVNLFDSYIKHALPDVSCKDKEKDIPRRLLKDMDPGDPVEEILGSLLVAAYTQALKMIGKSNQPGGYFSVPYEKANPEAMGYMRIVCQLSSNLLKFRKERSLAQLAEISQG